MFNFLNLSREQIEAEERYARYRKSYWNMKEISRTTKLLADSRTYISLLFVVFLAFIVIDVIVIYILKRNNDSHLAMDVFVTIVPSVILFVLTCSWLAPRNRQAEKECWYYFKKKYPDEAAQMWFSFLTTPGEGK